MSEPVGVAILTPMPLEFGAVHAHLSDTRRIWHSAGTAAEVGTVPGVPWPVAVILTGEGNGDAGALAERVSAWLEPRMLLVVGVAGSLKEDVTLGDVVVATWVYGYHGGKEDNSGFHARPRAWRSHHRLTQAAGILAAIGDRLGEVARKPAVGAPQADRRRRRRAELPDQPAPAATARALQRRGGHRDGERGGHGRRLPPGQAARTDIRGISDLADGRKHLSDRAGLQPVAAAHAAAFAMAILRELPPDFAASPAPGRERRKRTSPAPAGGRSASRCPRSGRAIWACPRHEEPPSWSCACCPWHRGRR